MINLSMNYFDTSIKRMVIFSFMIMLLIPIGFSITSLFQNSWSQAQQRMLEKHQLISEALVEPFTLFIQSRQRSLAAIGDEIQANSDHKLIHLSREKHKIDYKKTIQRIVDKYYNSFDDLAAVSFISTDKNIKVMSTNDQNYSDTKFPSYSKLSLTSLKSDNDSSYKDYLISPAFTSSFSNKPVVLLNHLVIDKNNNEIGSIRAEVSLKYIESMCSKINFGVLGHCATVDQMGHVVSHPNKNWTKEIRDLSKISIVTKMLAGQSGTTEFYSPFLKADMVAGYSAVPVLGWGIMIPQPKSELTQSFDTIRFQTYLWLIGGIIVALLLAYILMNKITSPIYNLIDRTKEVDSGNDYIDLGAVPENSPNEIRQLWKSFATLVAGLQKSNSEVTKLNNSLKSDISKATKKLRDMNKDLYEISNQDYLTTIANRRYFNTHLHNVLKAQDDETVGIIAIDLDSFKKINDTYGHDAGDLVLQHLSEILTSSTRKNDLVARFGGDEFAVYVKNVSDEELTGLAEKIRCIVESSYVQFKDKKIQLTISVGLINYAKNKKNIPHLDELLINADKAMYISKQNGRNQVCIHEVKSTV